MPPLTTCLDAVLGPDFGFVQGIYFDKPPGGTWAVPLHRDVVFPVCGGEPDDAGVRRPTIKDGEPYAELPVAVLERMLIARIHLDDAASDNGPLEVVPGSHRAGKSPLVPDAPRVTVFAGAGDVLLMRPLLAHASGKSDPASRRRRRVVHLVFAERMPPGGWNWNLFVPRLRGLRSASRPMRKPADDPALADDQYAQPSDPEPAGSPK